MSEDTYLKDGIKKCVDYVMSKNDEDKRRIITGMFQYNDYLINEQLVVKALNDEEKQEWFNNEIFEIKNKEIERLHSIIKEVREQINKDRAKNNYEKEGLIKQTFYCNKTDKLLEILDKESINEEKK